MGWFSDVFEGVSDFIGGGGDWIGPAISAVGSVAGAVIGSEANKSAADTAANAARAQADAIAEGNALAQQRFELIQQQTAPALAYQQQAITGAKGLTPYQEQQIEDSRRQTLGALSASGLRGSGRSTVAAVRAVEGDQTGQFLNENMRRADVAAHGLASQYFDAAGNAARIDQSTGQAQGAAAGAGGMFDAQAGVANAGLRGQALGDIAAVVSDSWKEGRKSSYAPKDDAIDVGEDTRRERVTL